jgi:hypothetical protein
MKTTPKAFSGLGAAILAVGLAVTLAPVSRAQLQSAGDSAGSAPSAAATSSSSGSAPAATPAAAPTAAGATQQQRLEDLEKEVSALQQQIAALQQADTPGLKTAAYSLNAPPPADDAPAKVTFAGLLGPMTISGFVDGYYAFNFNQPNSLSGEDFSNGIDGNTLRFFDESTNQFSLNAVEMVVDKAADATPGGTGRAGYHVGFIYGQAAEAINGTVFNGTSHTDFNNVALKEAYVDYIAPIGKGLTLTFGKFVTPAGNEVIETNGNWNYSRSILFYYAIPFFHYGVSAKYTFNPKWSVTGYLVNGWNNTTEFNTGKTYGVSIAWTPNAKWAITENYLAGPQCNSCFTGYVGKPNDNWRQLEDATIAYTPNMKWAFALNGDYGYGDRTGDFEDPADNSKPVDWWGVAAYAKYNFSPNFYAALRYEYFSDPDGFTLPFGFEDGGSHAGEGTATLAYNLTSALQTRFEFRDDYSNRDIFEKGVRGADTQPVVELGVIYTFSSANAK